MHRPCILFSASLLLVCFASWAPAPDKGYDSFTTQGYHITKNALEIRTGCLAISAKKVAQLSAENKLDSGNHCIR